MPQRPVHGLADARGAWEQHPTRNVCAVRCQCARACLLHRGPRMPSSTEARDAMAQDAARSAWSRLRHLCLHRCTNFVKVHRRGSAQRITEEAIVCRAEGEDSCSPAISTHLHETAESRQIARRTAVPGVDPTAVNSKPLNHSRAFTLPKQTGMPIAASTSMRRAVSRARPVHSTL